MNTSGDLLRFVQVPAHRQLPSGETDALSSKVGQESGLLIRVMECGETASVYTSSTSLPRRGCKFSVPICVLEQSSTTAIAPMLPGWPTYSALTS